MKSIKEFLIYGFAAYGVGWALLEPLTAFFPLVIEHQKLTLYVFLIGLSTVFGVWRARPLSSIEVHIPYSDTTIRIKFGNIFDEKNIAIGVNEYFDSSIETHVAESSLHGQFIRNLLSGKPKLFNELVFPALAQYNPKVIESKSGNNKAYPIGATAAIKIKDRRIFLFALSRTHIDTLKAEASIHELWDALAGLWNSVRVSIKGEEVAVPLVGAGLSGIGLPPEQLINLIITSIIFYTKKTKITKTITIVLSKRTKRKISLRRIYSFWSPP